MSPSVSSSGSGAAGSGNASAAKQRREARICTGGVLQLSDGRVTARSDRVASRRGPNAPRERAPSGVKGLQSFVHARSDATFASGAARAGTAECERPGGRLVTVVSWTRTRLPAHRAGAEPMPIRPHLVDTTLFFSPTSGGVRRYLLAKHAWLAAHAHVRHTLLVPGARRESDRDGIVHFPSPRIPGGAGYRFPWRLGDLSRRLAALQPDLVEAGDPYQVGWTVADTARALGIPAVAFCHSELVGLARARVGRAAATLAAAWLRTLYSRFDLVLAPSRLVVERLQLAGIAHAVVQPLGVDADTFSPARADEALRATLALRPGTRLLVFAGRLAPEKNLDELETTVERLGDPYHLLVIGGAASRRTSPRVTFLPYQREPARLAAWLGACDALVHAGRCETFGLVALEALACGVPVVGYAAGALPEIVVPAVGVLAPPTGPAALADAVTALFERERTAVRAAARAHVVREYTWERALTRQLRLYARLLERPTLLRSDRALHAT